MPTTTGGDGDWDADSVAVNDLRGSGVGTDGVRIYGGSAIAGLWRVGEAGTGAGHTLALSLPLAALAPTYVWPATELSTSREASMLGPVPVGQHVALPRDWDVEALTTPERRAPTYACSSRCRSDKARPSSARWRSRVPPAKSCRRSGRWCRAGAHGVPCGAPP